MASVVMFDCEFLTAAGAPRRYWCGPRDPDPIVVQIGAVRLDPSAPFEIADRFSVLIDPADRFGAPVVLYPLFVRLTGITRDMLDDRAVGLRQALRAFDAFTGGASIWSWGKDEMNLIAISCFVAGLAAPIPARRFGKACKLLLVAGMPLDDVQSTMSTGLCAYHDLPEPLGRAHDALFDATSLATVVQHHPRAGRLCAADFDPAKA